MHKLRKFVTFFPMLLLLAGVALSLADSDQFLLTVSSANTWILRHFSDFSNWASFGFVVTMAGIWFSGLGKVKIGGKNAEPILSKWNWFAITLCTTIAIGILFWATAEPLYHFHQPPALSGIEPSSPDARRFAMSSLFMHWTITPYAIYSIPSLAFALAYYNLGKSYSLAGPISLVIGRRAESHSRHIVDAVAVFALVAGLSATLGVGVLSIASGISDALAIPASAALMAFVVVLIVGAFTVSSVSGLMNGIRILSDWNVRFFFVLCAVVIAVGPAAEMLEYGLQGLRDYAVEFLPRSTGEGATADKVWANSWTTFYWANWLAWAPVTALFLGRIAKGYTVREFILFNLVLPSTFAVVWMSIFGASAIEMDKASGILWTALQNDGPERVVYVFFGQLPGAAIWPFAFILLSFVCFVTAADSNTEAVASICLKDEAHQAIAKEDKQKPIQILKISWAILIGATAWIMVSYSGVDGVRMLSNLGGLPALFIVLFMNVALILMATRKFHLLKK